MKQEELEKIAKQIRQEVVKMTWQAGGAHLGGALSSTDLLTGLFFANYKKPQDHFILSNGHVCPAYYAILARLGKFSSKKLTDLRKMDSGLEGHPVRNKLPGVETTSGSLGHGLSVGLGLAWGLKLDKKLAQVFVMMGDGDHQEGSTWEAIMAAGHYQTDNLKVIIDRNQMQIGGPTEKQLQLEPLAKKYRDFGWQVKQINGHNYKQILSGLDWLKKTSGQPTALIGFTVRGKGISFLENTNRSHSVKFEDKSEYEKALKEVSK